MKRINILVVLFLVFLLMGCVKRVGKIEDVVLLSDPPYYVGDELRFEIRAHGISNLRVLDGEDVLYKGTFRSDLTLKLDFGEHTLRFEGYDSDWNLVHTWDLGPISVHDPTPPVVDILVSPEDPTDEDLLSVTVEATDPESGISKVELEDLDSGRVYPDGVFRGHLDAGEHRFLGYAENGDGKRTTQILSFRVGASGDEEAPRIDAEIPQHVLPGEDIEMNVFVTDDKGLSWVEIRLDGVLLEHVDVPDHRDVVRVSKVLKAPSSQRELSVEISAEDVSGKVSKKEYTVQVSENSPPEIDLELSDENPDLGEEVEVSVRARDEDGIDRLELYLDDELLTFSRSDSLTFDLKIDFEGVKTLTAVAYDELGAHSSASARIRVRSPDNDPPVIKLSVPDEIPVSKPQELVAVVYDESDIASVVFSIYRGEDEIGRRDGESRGGSIYEALFTFDLKGEYRVVVRATDEFGNTSEVSKNVEVLGEESIGAPKINFSIYPKVLEMEETLNAVVIAEDPDGLSRSDFYIDDMLVDSKEFATSNRLDFKWLATLYGQHMARVVVYDLKGNFSEASDTFTVETEVPTASFVFPNDAEELPYSENSELELMVKVLDTSSPISAYFDVIGGESTTLKAFQEGESPNYVFRASWIPPSPGDYKLRFRYRNALNISCETEIEIHLKDTEVIFRLPSSNIHVAGHDMDVWIIASRDVESGELVLVTPDSKEHPIPLDVEERADGTKSFTGTIPGSMFMTLTEGYSYVLKFTAVSGEIRKTHNFYFMVVDNEPPKLDVEIDGNPVHNGEMIDLDINLDHVLIANASDNYSLDSIKLYKDDALLSFTSSESLNANLELNTFENRYRVVAVDTKGNATEVNFSIYASESNPPVATPSNVKIVVVEGGILNTNEESKVNYGDFELSDDTGLDEVYYSVEGPGGYEFDGVLWKGSGDKYTRISVDRNGNFYIKVGSVPGFYQIYLKAKDVFGNETTLGSTIVEVRDMVGPVVEVEIEDVERYYRGYPVISGNGIGIRVYALDDLESIERIGLIVEDASGDVLKLDDSPEYPGSFYDFSLNTYPNLSDGIAKITGIATTSGGNFSSSTVYAIIDNFKSPHVELILPETVVYGGLRVYSGVITMEARISNTSVPQDIGKVFLIMDGSTEQTLEGGFSSSTVFVSVDTTLYESSPSHRLTVEVVDEAGNTSEVLEGVNSFEVIFDNEPPNPIYGEVLGKSAILTGENPVEVDFQENTRVGGIMLDVWNGSKEEIISTDKGNATVVSDRSVLIDMSSFFDSEGTANYTMYSYDVVGNTGVSSGIFYYDTSPPVGTFTGVEGLVSDVAVSDASLEMELFDGVTWVSTLTFWATSDDGQVQEEESFSLEPMTWNYEYGWTPFASSEGTARVFARVEDPLEHFFVVSTDLRYDTLEPTFSLDFEDAVKSEYYPRHVFLDEDMATITWVATDMNFQGISFDAWIGETRIWSLDSASDSGEATLALSKDATHLLNATAEDLARFSTERYIIVSDMTTPVITSATLTNLTTSQSSTLENESTITLSEEETLYEYKLEVGFDELWPDYSRIRITSETGRTLITSENYSGNPVECTLKFSTDDTLTVEIVDVLSREATWVIPVDVR